MAYLEELFNLKNKIAVITGGLGIIGTEYVKAFVNSGVKVCVIDINEMSDKHELSKLNKDDFMPFKANITDRNEVEDVLKKVKKKWGKPEILVNNAALDFPPSKSGNENFENYPIEKLKAVMDVNLVGMVICCQVFGGVMAKKGKGSIINICSTYGLLGPDQRIYKNFVKPVSYSVTKSGVLNLTRYLATYWAKKGVRVNTLTPGGVYNNQDKNFVDGYSFRTPLGRMADRKDYCGAMLYLASDSSSYMTGANLVVDGGWTAW